MKTIDASIALLIAIWTGAFFFDIAGRLIHVLIVIASILLAARMLRRTI